MSTVSSKESTDEGPQDRQPAIEWENAPDESDKVFRQYTRLNRMKPEHLTEPQRPRLPDDASEKIKHRQCYASFSEYGTTVSVNSHGRIMQISRFLGFGRSGFFCADQKNLPEPYLVQQRMDDIMNFTDDCGRGLRLNIDSLVNMADLKLSSLDWVFYRWPRFVFKPKPKFTANSSNPGNDPQHDNASYSSSEPSPSSSSPDVSELSIQYFCHQGTVFQRYLFDFQRGKALPEGLDQLKIDADVLLRNLDFERDDSIFNEYHEDHEDHEFRSGPNGRGLVILHRFTLAMANQMGIETSDYSKTFGPKAAALLVTPFSCGAAQNVKQIGDDWYIDLSNSEAVKKEYIDTGRIDVTLAYRLQLMKERQGWKNLTVPAAHLQRMGQAFCLNKSYKRIRFSPNDQLNFSIQRNLEHMLSICCIPILKSPSLGNVDTTNDEDGGVVLAADEDSFTIADDDSFTFDEEDTSIDRGYIGNPSPLPVAIICGDIAGHFYWKKNQPFLCLMLRFLSPKQSTLRQYLDNPRDCDCKGPVKNFKASELCGPCRGILRYWKDLRNRVQGTLKWHARWMCDRAESLEDGTFSPHYWPTGKAIQCWDWLPPPSLVDTPLQLLKIFSLYRLDLDHDAEDRKEIPDWIRAPALRSKIRCWILELNKSNRQGSHAYLKQLSDDLVETHSIEQLDNEDAKFRLADHVMICLALKCAQELGLGHGTAETSKERHGPTEYRKGDHVFEEYKYERVRRKVLKRFTTEDPISKQRMLTTCRTPTQSRFLFHSKDTFLFHAMDTGFFQDGGKPPELRSKKQDAKQLAKFWGNTDSRWKNTVDAQVHYDVYQYLEWEKPLWYALVFILGCQRRQVCNLSVEKTLRATANALLAQSFSNGIFSGLLDEEQEPIPFRNEKVRDNYWHAIFEIPYVLWTYGKDYFNAQSTRGKTGSKDVSTTAPDLPQPLDITAFTEALAARVTAPSSIARTGKLAMKTVPFDIFGSLVDRNRLVKVSDDWLQKDRAVSNLFFQLDFHDGVCRLASLHTDPSNDERTPSEVLLAATAHRLLDDQYLVVLDKTNRGAVIDIPRESFGKAKLDQAPKTNYEIWIHLRKPRTFLNAKKRIIWLPNGNDETAMMCFIAVPTAEKDRMLQFFDKHASHEKYLSDRATSALNEWETELHLSFLRRDECESKMKGEFGEDVAKGISNVSFVEIYENNGAPNKKTTFLSQETMSFRFMGDYFDRFWTCHFLESRSERSTGTFANRLRLLRTALNDEETDERFWQQRKVLELLLYHEMLEKIYDRTKEILDWAKREVFQDDVSGTALDPGCPTNPLADAVRSIHLLQKATIETYSGIVDKWRQFQQILQAVEDDLNRNIEVINQWRRREEERGSEKPRWTLNDERKYRAVITRIEVLNQRRVQEIMRLSTSIKFFRESLPSQLESIREDISFHGSENINLFTYVTVVFLPLGFSTGIFSMSQAPSHSTLVSMIVLASIAITLTVFALANAKTTGKAVMIPIIKLFRWINNMMLYPVVASKNWGIRLINRVFTSSLSWLVFISGLFPAHWEGPIHWARERWSQRKDMHRPEQGRTSTDMTGGDAQKVDVTGWCPRLPWKKQASKGKTDEENGHEMRSRVAS